MHLAFLRCFLGKQTVLASFSLQERLFPEEFCEVVSPGKCPEKLHSIRFPERIHSIIRFPERELFAPAAETWSISISSFTPLMSPILISLYREFQCLIVLLEGHKITDSRKLLPHNLKSWWPSKEWSNLAIQVIRSAPVWIRVQCPDHEGAAMPFSFCEGIAQHNRSSRRWHHSSGSLLLWSMVCTSVPGSAPASDDGHLPLLANGKWNRSSFWTLSTVQRCCGLFPRSSPPFHSHSCSPPSRMWSRQPQPGCPFPGRSPRSCCKSVAQHVAATWQLHAATLWNAWCPR